MSRGEVKMRRWVYDCNVCISLCRHYLHEHTRKPSTRNSLSSSTFHWRIHNVEHLESSPDSFYVFFFHSISVCILTDSESFFINPPLNPSQFFHFLDFFRYDSLETAIKNILMVKSLCQLIQKFCITDIWNGIAIE